jgi:hypothetical protein
MCLIYSIVNTGRFSSPYDSSSIIQMMLMWCAAASGPHSGVTYHGGFWRRNPQALADNTRVVGDARPCVGRCALSAFLVSLKNHIWLT